MIIQCPSCHQKLYSGEGSLDCEAECFVCKHEFTITQNCILDEEITFSPETEIKKIKKKSIKAKKKQKIIHIVCNNCGHNMDVSENLKGKIINCLVCNRKVIVRKLFKKPIIATLLDILAYFYLASGIISLFLWFTSFSKTINISYLLPINFVFSCFIALILVGISEIINFLGTTAYESKNQTLILLENLKKGI